MTTRTMEQTAPGELAKYIAQLAELTKDQPTTAELEEALMLVPCLNAILRSWVSSRHIIQSHAHRAAGFTEDHPAVAAVVMGLRQRDAVKAYGPGQVALRQVAEQGFSDCPVTPVETETERLELDRIENAHVHAAFAPCLDMIQRRPM